jgi:hypothetical protein
MNKNWQSVRFRKSTIKFDDPELLQPGMVSDSARDQMRNADLLISKYVKRPEIAQQMLCDIFTGDKTWIYADDPRSSVSASADIERPTRMRRIISQKKFVFWICSSRTGVFDVVALPPGERSIRNFFVDKVMGSFVRIWAKKRPTKQGRGALLQMDNASPRFSPETFEYHGITRLPHPLYSPDLSRADFWLFGYIKAMLEGFFFQDINEPRDRIAAIVKSIPPGTFTHVFHEWKERLAECISRDGEYLTTSKSKNAKACSGRKLIRATGLSALPGCWFFRKRY